VMQKPGERVMTQIQPVGWCLGIFGVVFPFVLGYVFADGILLVVAVLSILVLCICRILGRRNLQKLEVQIEMQHRFYVGKGADMKVYLDNKKSWLDSFFVKVSIELLHKVRVESTAQWVSNGTGARFEKRISFPLRGVATEVKLGLTSLFPLGLYSHKRQSLQPRAILVYPRLINPLELLAHGALNDIDPQRGVHTGEETGEPRGIRAWQPGDAAKRINWPASARSIARGQDLKVREFDPPGFIPNGCVVLFHSHASFGEVYRHDRFERACSLAAGTLHYLHSRQVKASFTSDFLGWQLMESNNRSQYIELLALLAQSERSLGTDTEMLQTVVNEVATQTDQIIIVSDVDPDAWSTELTMPENTMVIDIRQMRFGRRALSKAS